MYMYKYDIVQPLPSISLCRVQGPQDYQQLRSFAIRTHRSHTAAILLVTVYYSQRIQMKISRGKRHIGQVLGDSRAVELPPILCQWSHMVSTHSSSNNRWNTHGILPTREAHWALVSEVFIVAWLSPMWLTLVSSPSRGYRVAQCPSPYITLLAEIIRHGWRPQVNKNTLIRQDIPRV